MRILLAVAACFPCAASALANDTAAEIAVGGLTMTQSDAISMDSEELFISSEAVRVAYRFTNTSDQDIKTLVAFPLPDISMKSFENDGSFPDYKQALQFKTTADGKPLALEFVERAMLGDVDVTERVKSVGLPVLADLADFIPAFEALPPETRQKLVADGMVEDIEPDPNTAVWVPNWVVRTSATRTQIFPAGKTISVKHSYVPIAGGTVAGSLDPENRKGDNREYYDAKISKYCIDDGWLASFDKRLAKERKSSGTYSELWLGYVLSSGANWKGPIGDFRLVVDKGKPDSLVSFCADGVKKISPTQFEIRKTDYEPDSDISILIVNWYKME
jgi:Domain of unknown function (DUF4424)